MKFAFIADLHLSGYSNDRLTKDNLPEKLDSIMKTLYNVVGQCREKEIDTIVIGGDILHGKSIIYTIAQSEFLDFLRYNQDTKFIIIDGNHDLSSRSKSYVSALKALDSEHNVFRVSDNYYHKDMECLFVSYSTHMIDLIKNSEAKILVSHLGLSEGILNSGISLISNLSMNDLRGRYKLVLLGHYHKPQQIIEEDISMYYVGSLIQLDWRETGDEKRFLIVNTDTLEVEEVPTSGYKKYIEFSIKEDNKQQTIEEAKKVLDEGNYVRIIKEEKVDTKGLDDFIIIDKVEKDITNRGITSTMSQEDRLKRYLEIKDIQESDQPIYFETAKLIIESCKPV